jgi:hypothetical protein
MKVSATLKEPPTRLAEEQFFNNIEIDTFYKKQK